MVRSSPMSIKEREAHWLKRARSLLHLKAGTRRASGLHAMARTLQLPLQLLAQTPLLAQNLPLFLLAQSLYMYHCSSLMSSIRGLTAEMNMQPGKKCQLQLFWAFIHKAWAFAQPCYATFTASYMLARRCSTFCVLNSFTASHSSGYVWSVVQTPLPRKR
eukprot:1160675-Pelagomonas_calceolata.AAC.23